eukprot:106938-Hanusia_phi.AAC.1
MQDEDSIDSFLCLMPFVEAANTVRSQESKSTRCDIAIMDNHGNIVIPPPLPLSQNTKKSETDFDLKGAKSCVEACEEGKNTLGKQNESMDLHDADNLPSPGIQYSTEHQKSNSRSNSFNVEASRTRAKTSNKCEGKGAFLSFMALN